MTEADWARLRHTWHHQHGLTNVWLHPPLNGAERYRGNGRRVAPRVHNPGRNATAHLNQKPLEFMRRIVKAPPNEGDTIWEPFGGLCSASVAAIETGRNAFAAEPDPTSRRWRSSDSPANSQAISCRCGCDANADGHHTAATTHISRRGRSGNAGQQCEGCDRRSSGLLPNATRIAGLDGGELFNLSAVLGSAIEVQVVETLNRTRAVWDPDDRWPRHRFVRSAQTFPDVRLLARNERGDAKIALGIELKGWYLLSKEREPSFRYTVTPTACAPQDLLVVVPWHLKNVLSGEPVVYEPYIEQARYVAEFRNWWWENVRETSDTLDQRQVKHRMRRWVPYPAPKTRTADRLSRTGGRTSVGSHGSRASWTNTHRPCGRNGSPGIPADHWTLFFKRHAEAKDPVAILDHLTRDLRQSGLNKEVAADVAEAISRIVDRSGRAPLSKG